MARDRFEPAGDVVVRQLFGPEITAGDEGSAAGELIFSEGRLLAWPARSINRPFLHVTAPLVLERLARDLRALGLAELLPGGWRLPRCEAGQALVADAALAGHDLVVEDLFFEADRTVQAEAVAALGRWLTALLPVDEQETRERLAAGLVLIPDADFAELVRRTVPVRAGVKLTAGKTTSRWDNPEDGSIESGSLWYEESLPPECLFLAIVGSRRRNGASVIGLFREHAPRLRTVQLGGNETVGEGLCLWHCRQEAQP